MTEQVFEGSAGAMGAAIAALLAAIAVLLLGLFLLQQVAAPPVGILAVLLLSVLVFVLVSKLINTDATYAIESDALVITRGRNVQRLLWTEIEEATFNPFQGGVPDAHIVLRTRAARLFSVRCRRLDQRNEIEAFFAVLRTHVPVSKP